MWGSTKTTAVLHAAQVTPCIVFGPQSCLWLTPFVSSAAESGFRAYNVDPFREFFRNVFKEGGIGIVEMLYRCVRWRACT